MPIPQNKDELIFEITHSYKKLKIDLENVSVENSKLKTLEGHAKGTTMSVSDLVSYLIGWGELVLKWRHKKEQEEQVDFPETGFKWNELGKLAQKFYTDYEDLHYETLLQKLDEVINKILVLVKNTSNADLYEKTWYKNYTQGRMIQLNTSSPYKNARARVRKWQKTKFHKQ